MMLSIHQIKSSDLKLKHQYPTLMGPDKDYRQLLDSLFKQTIRIIFLLDVHFVLTQINKEAEIVMFTNAFSVWEDLWLGCLIF